MESIFAAGVAEELPLLGSVRDFSKAVEHNNTQYSAGSVETCRTAAMTDYILKNVVQLLGHEEEEEEKQHWVSHCRWYSLGGVQHVLGFLQDGHSVPGLVQERGDCEGGLDQFIALSELAVGAVLKALSVQ